MRRHFAEANADFPAALPVSLHLLVVSRDVVQESRAWYARRCSADDCGISRAVCGSAERMMGCSLTKMPASARRLVALSRWCHASLPLHSG